MDSDKLVTAAQDRLAKSFGFGSTAIPWAQILAMVLQMLSGCLGPTPTAAEVKAAVDRPLFKILFMRRLHQQGIYGLQAEKIYTATVATLKSANDDEIKALIATAQETA